MPKIKAKEQVRKRVQNYRGVLSILQRDTISLLEPCRLRKKLTSECVQTEQKENTKVPISATLRSWALEYNIRRRGLSALLKILISFGFSSLPKDSRTLLKTPRTVPIESVAGGQYWYNGISNCLRNIFAKLNSNITIKLNFNIDGLPLFKSSPVELWPILANIHDMPDIKPMVIGIWSGTGKPKSLTEFLDPLVNDLCAVTRDGITINGYHIEVKIRCFICDSPARSFLKGLIFQIALISDDGKRFCILLLCFYFIRNRFFQPPIWLFKMLHNRCL